MLDAGNDSRNARQEREAAQLAPTAPPSVFIRVIRGQFLDAGGWMLEIGNDEIENR